MLSNEANFLFLLDTTKGNFIFPRSTEHKSDIKDDVVGPAPAPSPCKILCPTGLESTITAFKTPLILPMYELLLMKAGGLVV